MKRILVIEDDPQILAGLKDNLAAEGYEVLTAADGESGLAMASGTGADAIIVDVMLPRLNALDFCRLLKRKGRSPILVLFARAQQGDEIFGFELAGDHNLTKPFNIDELLANLRGIIRRVKETPEPDRIKFGAVEVDFPRQVARRNKQETRLSTLEADVLHYLAGRCGRVVSREQLLYDVWGYQAFPTTRSVDNVIVRLRYKLEDDPHEPRYILTVHGTGYKFVA